MRIIKVNATESTNTLAREWYQSQKDTAPFGIIAHAQTSGRGQRGSNWISNTGENLTMSIVYPKPSVKIKDQFLISAGVGLAILEILMELKFNNLKLKWPNDIMAANFKIGGILIENILSNGMIGASIIGLGLNVNQTHFPSLPKASSLKSLSGKSYEIEELGEKVAFRIKKKIDTLEKCWEEIFLSYEKVLFRKNKVSTFKLKDEELVTGIIKGVTTNGLLKVEVEDRVIHNFDLKELKLLF